MDFACAACGHRQPSTGQCGGCGDPATHDLGRPETLALLRDIDLRRTLKRQGKLRAVGVGAAMVIVFGLWLIPGYWSLRGTLYPGLPLFFDQWLLMALVTFGAVRVLESKYGIVKRFPYVADEPEVEP